MAGNVYIPKLGFVTFEKGGIYLPKFGFFDTGIAKPLKPTTSNMLLYGRGFERSINRGRKR